MHIHGGRRQEDAHRLCAVGGYFPAHAAFVIHFDGTEWTGVTGQSGPNVLNGVWASSPIDVFAVGSSTDGGPILHFNGHGWFEMGVPAGLRFNDIWGASPADIYAVGSGIAHYDGQRWTQVSGQGGRGVWASSPTDVFVVGDDGTILHGTP